MSSTTPKCAGFTLDSDDDGETCNITCMVIEGGGSQLAHGLLC